MANISNLIILDVFCVLFLKRRIYVFFQKYNSEVRSWNTVKFIHTRITEPPYFCFSASLKDFVEVWQVGHLHEGHVVRHPPRRPQRLPGRREHAALDGRLPVRVRVAAVIVVVLPGVVASVGVGAEGKETGDFPGESRMENFEIFSLRTSMSLSCND